MAQVRDLIRPGTVVLESGLGQEEERARTAVDLAREGHAVALIGSGDAGVYAMASPALEMADDTFDVVGVPGITAALAAAALLGAPLGHDHAAISLSDLHTPWPAIERRVPGGGRGRLRRHVLQPAQPWPRPPAAGRAGHPARPPAADHPGRSGARRVAAGSAGGAHDAGGRHGPRTSTC